MSKKISKFLVPACMILGIVALWFYQQQQEQATPVTQVTNDDFALAANAINLEELKKHKLPIIIDFGADSCIPCKEMAPVLIKLNAAMQNKAIIKFVDVWKHPEAAKGFPVQVIPTQIFINADGTPYVPKKIADIKFLKYSSKEDNKHAFTAHQGGLTEEQMIRILAELQ